MSLEHGSTSMADFKLNRMKNDANISATVLAIGKDCVLNSSFSIKMEEGENQVLSGLFAALPSTHCAIVSALRIAEF